MNKRLRGLALALLAVSLITAAVFWTLLAAPPTEFRFLRGYSRIHNLDVIVATSATTDILSTAITYETQSSLQDVINLASKELYPLGWSRLDPVLGSRNTAYALGGKYMVISDAFGKTRVTVQEVRTPSAIDRARVWMKGLWKKSK